VKPARKRGIVGHEHDAAFFIALACCRGWASARQTRVHRAMPAAAGVGVQAVNKVYVRRSSYGGSGY
jgi:hypothetical protein